MAKKKGESRVIVTLECTVCRSSDSPNVYRYSTTKNRRNTTGKLELKKYCRFDRKHTTFKEVK